MCVTCCRPVLGFRDDVSASEYGISQMCQHCQDGVFVDLEEILDELGIDIDDSPSEEALIALAQKPGVSVTQQRWIAAELYAIAYKRDGGTP